MTSFPLQVVLDGSQTVVERRRIQGELGQLERDARELSRRSAETLKRSYSNALDTIRTRARDTRADLRGLAQRVRTEGLRDAREALGRVRERSREVRQELRNLAQQVRTEGLERVNATLGQTERRTRRLGGLFQTVFVGASVLGLARAFARTSDAATNVENRLRLVTDTSEELAATQERLFRISTETRVAFDATATVFTRLAQSSDELGRSNSELLDFTRSLNQAIALSGATAEESRNGLIQLSQGLAAGALRGDELRSVLEQLPGVARVIAQGLDVTVGELRELGEQGAITADSIIDAFARASGQLESDFATTVPKIGQAFTNLGTSLTQTIDKFNEITGVAQFFARTIEGLAVVLQNNLADGLADIDVLTDSTDGLREAAANTQREINQLLERAGDAALSAAQAERLELLQNRLAATQSELRNFSSETIAAAAAEKEADLAAKAREETLARQEQLLKDVLRPQQEFAQRLQDLEALARQGKLTLDEYNAALLATRQPGPQSGADAFQEELDGLLKLNEELEIQANNIGNIRDLKLLDLELTRRGFDLSAEGNEEQQRQLIEAVTAQNRLREQIQKRAETERELAQITAQRANRREALVEELTLTNQVTEAARELLQLRIEESELVPQIDQAFNDLRIRQLEASNELGDGFERAIRKIRNEAQDLASVGESVVDAFANRATDAITEFVTTGQLNFREFTQSLLADITRIIARLLVVQAIQAATNGLFNSGENLGNSLATRQSGGPAPAGQPLIVGERRPEVFVPTQGGTIVPSVPQALAASAPQQQNLNVAISDSNERFGEFLEEEEGGDKVFIQLGRRRDELRRLVFG